MVTWVKLLAVTSDGCGGYVEAGRTFDHDEAVEWARQAPDNRDVAFIGGDGKKRLASWTYCEA